MARNIYDDILRDARVKLTEMFNNNFREQGFFGQKWVATKTSKVNKRGKGSILIVTGAMRRSIKSYVSGMAVVFSSHLPYTALHNEGGNVKPFETFRKDVEVIDSKYNTNYLLAEYNHALHTSQKWLQNGTDSCRTETDIISNIGRRKMIRYVRNMQLSMG
ncbi:MAG: hypothetical protein HDS24_03390 [Bacteroides sp.]|nr:hypothetical protein [Bacteroides sp.]